MKLFDRIRAFLRDEPDETNEYDGEDRAAVEEEAEDEPVDEPVDTGEVRSVRARHVLENERKLAEDFCEQLIDASAHMEEAKREYRIVTEYLSDIQRIEALPVSMANELIQTAEQIDRLDKDRQTYIQSENLLPVEQYNLLSACEDEVIDTIKNLNDMEMRDSMLKSDMGHLEGEKEDLKYNRLEYTDRAERLRGIIITVLVLFLLTSGGLLAYAVAAKKSVTLYALLTGAVAMIAFAIFYVRYSNLQNEVRDTDAKLNRAISLLNKVKVKYINNTNALDYIYEKYDINSAKELEYRWELYNTMVRDEKKYYQTNSELRVLHDALTAQLTRIGVRDPQVWLKQVGAITDRREMVEIKHGLNVRRQNLRERIATCEKIQDNARIALRASVAANAGMMGYIRELLAPYKIKIEN